MQTQARNICSRAASALRAQARRAVGLVLLLILLCGAAPKAAAVEWGIGDCDTTVYLATFLPGQEIYELEGHSALRIVTPYSDTAVTWGMFDFNAPHFVYRFVKGETDYSVAAVPWAPFLYSYMRQGRRTILQELKLTREQTRCLMALVEENLRPENRVYRYNYILDNCATRPLAIIEKTIGQKIDLPMTGLYTLGASKQATYRKIMRRYHANYPWYQFGIDLALGSRIDRTINELYDARELAFAPVLLAAMLERAKVKATADMSQHGISDPVKYDYDIVSNTTIIFDNGEEDSIYFKLDTNPDHDVPDECLDVLPPTPWYLTPWAAMVVLLALSCYAAHAVAVKWRRMRGFYCVFFGVNAVVGCVITFLVLFSEHYATSPNWLLLWLNPAAIVPAISVWKAKWDRTTLIYMDLHVIAMLAMCLIWPWIDQSANSAFWPWIAADFILSYAWMRRNAAMSKATEQQIIEYDKRSQEHGSKRHRLWPRRSKKAGYIYEIRDSRPDNRH